MPIAQSNIKLRLSGGASNSAAALSLGGAKSSISLSGNLFDDKSFAESSSGRTEYRCVYVTNEHATLTAKAARVWLSANTPGTSTQVLVALGTSVLNATEQSISGETSSPSGLSFSPAALESAAIQLGDIPPLGSRAIWFRCDVIAGAAVDPDEPWNIRIAFESEA